VQRLREPSQARERSKKRSAQAEDPYVRRARQVLERALGTEVTVRLKGGDAGEIRVPFHDAEDFARLLGLMTGMPASEL
jgi:hypothetical protein